MEKLLKKKKEVKSQSSKRKVFILVFCGLFISSIVVRVVMGWAYYIFTKTEPKQYWSMRQKLVVHCISTPSTYLPHFIPIFQIQCKGNVV